MNTVIDEATEPQEILAVLRATERSSKRQDRFDTFYRFYVTALLSLFGFYLSLGLVDEATIDASGIEWARTQAPLWVGLVAATMLSAGARSGINGGPLALDELEIHYILSSPLPRKVVLGGPTRRLALGIAAVGSITGAAAGELASRQLPGSQGAWVLGGLLAGVSIALGAIGAALAAQGSPGRRRVAAVIALVLPAWAVVDLVLGYPTSPTSFYGKLALWPLAEHWTAGLAIAASIGVLVYGWRRIGSGSIERAHNRSRLVRQIRFAIAQQDIRSLLLLRRQLGFETPRNRPWVRVRTDSRVESRFPVLVRDARSYLRWPLTRIARFVGLAVAAGLAAAGLWHGTTALIAALGITAYIAAIEGIEPLSQELDHPGMLELIPITAGSVILSHAISAAVAMAVFWLLVGLVATVAALDWHVGAVLAVSSIPAGAAAAAAAALSIKRFESPAMVAGPEVDGPRLVFRLLWPPALATTGALPLLAARAADGRGDPIGPPAVNTTAAVALLAGLAWAWIRFRDEFAESVSQATQEAAR